MLQNVSFPLSALCVETISDVKLAIMSSVRASVDASLPFLVETDKAIGAVLSHGGLPVAFLSRTLSQSEVGHSSVEKEAMACIEAVRKWNCFLSGRRFSLITDQKAVSFIFEPKNHGKTKNAKIGRWRLELMGLEFDVKYRPGSENVPADVLSRDCLNFLRNASVLSMLTPLFVIRESRDCGNM